MLFSAGTFTHVEPHHNPNEGRTIYNRNFDLIEGLVDNAFSGLTSGNTVVFSGVNTSVSSGYTLGQGLSPYYVVDVIDNPVFDSVSATSISAGTIYSGSTDVGSMLTAITSAALYSNSTAVPVTIGGISAGATFTAKTMSEMWNALLYPYQTPSFSSFANAGLVATYELGQTIATGSNSFSWAFNNASSVSANTVTIVQNISPSSTIYGPGSNTSPSAITLSAVYSAGTSTTTTLYTISATNTSGNSFSTTISRSWRPRIYYGTSATSPLVEADIKGLTSSALASGFAGTYSFLAGDYKYFCYPSSFGTATTFKDSSTNLDVAMETLFVVSITNTYGVTANYNVHRTTNILGSSINIIIS